MSLDPDLVRLLKRLKLGALAATLPERLTLARAQQLDYAAFLTLLLADEVQRRDQLTLDRRLDQASFEERTSLDGFDWSAPLQLDRRHLQEVFSLQFLAAKEHVILVGPVGVGKTFLAQALGSAAVRAGHSVLFARADTLLKDLAQARADHTFEKAFRRYLAPQLLIVAGALWAIGLHRRSAQQSSDWYELIIERHRRSSFAVTANRAVDEWLALFDDPILGNSALDRLANGAHQLVIEGPSYRAKLAPQRRGPEQRAATAEYDEIKPPEDPRCAPPRTGGVGGAPVGPALTANPCGASRSHCPPPTSRRPACRPGTSPPPPHEGRPPWSKRQPSSRSSIGPPGGLLSCGEPLASCSWRMTPGVNIQHNLPVLRSK